MRKLFDFLISHADKIRGGGSMSEPYVGRYCVCYLEGDRTRPMYWVNARDCADIFGGEVYHIKSNRKIYTIGNRKPPTEEQKA